MENYVVYNGALVPESELMHYAKGQTKKNAKYVKRERRNGRWVYYYANDKVNKVDKNKYNHIQSQIVEDTDAGNDYHKFGAYIGGSGRITESSDPNNVGKTVKQVADEKNSNAESLKRKQASSLAASQRFEAKLSDKSYQSKAKRDYYIQVASEWLNKILKKK